MSPENRRIIAMNWLVFPAMALLLLIAACNESEKPSISVFASPDDASSALPRRGEVRRSKCVTGDFCSGFERAYLLWRSVQDKNVTPAFTIGYGVMHRWRKLADGARVLLGRG